MKRSVILAVYDPPALGLPFLGVTIAGDGQVNAVAFDSAEAAAAHNARVAAELAKLEREQSYPGPRS